MSIAYVSAIVALGLVQVVAQNSSGIHTSSEWFTRVTDILSPLSTVQGQMSATPTSSLNLSVSYYSTDIYTSVSKAQTASMATTKTQTQMGMSTVSALVPSSTEPSSEIPSPGSAVSYSTGFSSNNASLMTSGFYRRFITPSVTTPRGAISSSTQLMSTLDASATTEFPDVAENSSFSDFGSPAISPTPSRVYSSVIPMSSPEISTFQQNRTSVMDINTGLDENANGGNLPLRTLLMSTSANFTPTPAGRDVSTVNFSSTQEGLFPVSSPEITRVTQNTVGQIYPSFTSRRLTTSTRISDLSLPSSNSQSFTYISKSVRNMAAELTLSDVISVNSTVSVSLSQLSSTEKSSVLIATATSVIAISTALDTFRAPVSSTLSDARTVNSVSNVLASDSHSTEILSVLSPTMSSERVVLPSQNTLRTRSIASSIPTIVFTSVPVIGTNRASSTGTNSMAPSAHENVISKPFSLNTTSVVSYIQLSSSQVTESQMSSSTHCSSMQTSVSNILSNKLSSRTLVETEHVVSSSTPVSVSDNAVYASSVESLRPSFTASTSKMLTMTSFDLFETISLSFGASSETVGSAYGTDSASQSIPLTRRKLDHSSTGPVSTDLISPSPTSLMSIIPSTTPVITIMGDIKFIFEFEGDCDRLILNAQLQIEFWQALIAVLSIHSYVHIPNEKVQPEDLTCKPFQAIFILKSLEYKDYVKFTEQNLTITKVGIPILDDMSVIEYEVTSVQVIPMAKKDVEKPKEMRHELDKEDIVIIVVAGVLFGFLLCMCVAIACRECYRRRRAASFNLVDVPRVNLDMDDFTLTKIPRPQVNYRENNPIGRAIPVYNGNRYTRPKHLPVSDVNSAETLRIRPVSTDSIQVRIQPHPDGVVVGVTCTPPRSPTRDSSTSEHSSPRSEASEPSKQTLLKTSNLQFGMSNPNFEGDDELHGVERQKYVIKEDEDEALL